MPFPIDRQPPEDMRPSYARNPCPLEPLMDIPSIGRQLRAWAHVIELGRRRLWVGTLTDDIAREAKRRGHGSYFGRWGREETAVLYAWAVELVAAREASDRELTRQHGPAKREKLAPRVKV